VSEPPKQTVLGSFFDRLGAPTAVPEIHLAANRGDYVAYEARDKTPARLQIIQSTLGQCQAPDYRGMYITHDQAGTEIILSAHNLYFLITGRNLAAVAHALVTEHCATLREFDPRQHTQPSDSSAPLIESIAVHDPREEARSRRARKDEAPEG
jgi:hypothetical protein